MTINGNEHGKNDVNYRRTHVTSFEVGSSQTPHEKRERVFLRKVLEAAPTLAELRQYTGVLLCGLSIWGTTWFLFPNEVLPGRNLFNMAGVVAAGYVFGHTLERYTTINPVVGMTLIGALYRNFGPPNFLDYRAPDTIDYHLRRIYPVIILTKGPLGWNWDYIKNNSVKVFSLATLPWIVECLSTAFFTHVLLEFPWYWGLHLGSILASVSPAVVVPTAMALSARGLGAKNQIAQLVANAGGLDTAFTEGMFGVINAAIFYPSPPVYRIVKALLAIFVGIGMGVFWGVLVDFIPQHNDVYSPTIRSLLMLSGGVLLTYACGYFGWGGTSGVAIMVCAGAAATRWSRRGWPLNDNPVAEVYKLLWRIFEPMLFTLSGYYLEVSQISVKELCLIIACLFAALFLRVLAAFLVSLANELSVKESLFIAVTWIPKAIVEAVLVRVAADSLWTDGATSQDERIAAQHSNIIVIAILITSTLGSALTTILGPILLSQDSRVAPEEFYRTQTLSPPPLSTDASRKNNNTSNSLQYIDIQ
ncbi:sodium/hydrogen exchanger 9B2-like isoform X2 [Pectinophora gossypiella]|uniref:sodium/hydrogen exchanger 9B2-like isoform X2 n=1 Tax=Pectinophora gossypiella TaxID=13191 RepID=UPI00214E20C2|nr:sodium/hydrogen exchanger 9B2-like isoform X2 [Pectinophora gossypiella]